MTVNTMKAAMLDGENAPFRLADVACPVPGSGQVLVRVHASGVNPLDTKIRAGGAVHARHPLRGILGIDMAGVVEQVGAGVTRFRLGDEVYGMTGGVGGVQGSLAEYAAVDAHLLARKPANLSMREAAALPLVVITAWEALVDRANVTAGQKVLIQVGGGGVGHVAIQIARAFGAEVFATDRAAKADALRANGATPIDRDVAADEQVQLFTGGRGFDLVYDAVGGAVLDASFASVRRFGQVVSALGWGTHALAPLSFRSGTYSGVFTLLSNATELIEAGKLIPRLTQAASFPAPSRSWINRRNKEKRHVRHHAHDHVSRLTGSVVDDSHAPAVLRRRNTQTYGTTLCTSTRQMTRCPAPPLCPASTTTSSFSAVARPARHSRWTRRTQESALPSSRLA